MQTHTTTIIIKGKQKANHGLMCVRISSLCNPLSAVGRHHSNGSMNHNSLFASAPYQLLLNTNERLGEQVQKQPFAEYVHPLRPLAYTTKAITGQLFK